MYDDVNVNDSLDYHLWALALSMGSRYTPRPMHTSSGYDVSSFYSLRQVGGTVAAPAGSPAATTMRYAHVEMLPRSAAHQMCEAFDIVVPDTAPICMVESRWRFWRLASRSRRRRRAPSSVHSVMVRVGAQGYRLPVWRSCVASWRTRPPGSGTSACACAGGRSDCRADVRADVQWVCGCSSNLVKNVNAANTVPRQRVMHQRACRRRRRFRRRHRGLMIKWWIESTPDLASALPGAPYTNTGELLRMVVAARCTDDHGSGGGGSRPSSSSSERAATVRLERQRPPGGAPRLDQAARDQGQRRARSCRPASEGHAADRASGAAGRQAFDPGVGSIAWSDAGGIRSLRKRRRGSLCC